MGTCRRCRTHSDDGDGRCSLPATRPLPRQQILMIVTVENKLGARTFKHAHKVRSIFQSAASTREPRQRRMMDQNNADDIFIGKPLQQLSGNFDLMTPQPAGSHKRGEQTLKIVCRPRWLKADRDLLERSGGLNIDLTERAIETVAEGQGAHGWWNPRVRLPRRPYAPQPSATAAACFSKYPTTEKPVTGAS